MMCLHLDRVQALNTFREGGSLAQGAKNQFTAISRLPIVIRPCRAPQYWFFENLSLSRPGGISCVLDVM